MPDEYIKKLTSVTKGRTAIFIDAANLERSVQSLFVNPKDITDNFKKYFPEQLCWRVDYEKLNIFFHGVCDVKTIKFYSADFQTPSHRNFFWFLSKALKIKLITKPLKEYADHSADHPHRKANFDVELAVDAVFNLNNYDTLLLFSGDCDFEYLLKFLRGHNKTTIVFSRSGHIAKELIPACNYYFDVVDFRQEFLKIDIKKQKIPPFSETRS